MMIYLWGEFPSFEPPPFERPFAACPIPLGMHACAVARSLALAQVLAPCGPAPISIATISAPPAGRLELRQTQAAVGTTRR
jgi:hypothetical protein